jgi:hypothetical protein
MRAGADVRVWSPENFADERVFWQRAQDLDRVVDDGLRHAADVIPAREVEKLGGLDAGRLDVRALDGHPMRERHGSRAVRSSRGDEDLNVRRLRGVLANQRPTGVGQSRIAAPATDTASISDMNS